MATHYQVSSEYQLTHGKPSLVGLTFNTTKSAVTTFPVMSDFSMLKTHRIFHTEKEAHFYIAYLKRVHKSSLPFPVLDNGQKILFKE